MPKNGHLRLGKDNPATGGAFKVALRQVLKHVNLGCIETSGFGGHTFGGRE